MDGKPIDNDMITQLQESESDGPPIQDHGDDILKKLEEEKERKKNETK